ncbi:MAG: sugar phosphate nucleotidyltransferase [Candidatus Woesearchaeota archaeon]
MKIVIPVAGFGSRLRPHTHSKPKPLLHVAGKSVLAYIIDDIVNTWKLSFSEMIFITGHLKEKMESSIRTTYSFESVFIEQKVRDGTAGAIGLSRTAFAADEDIFIIYADTIFEADLSLIEKVRHDPAIDGIIWVKEVEDYKRFGVAVLDAQGYITKFVEKPNEPISKLANIGVYYFKSAKKLFDAIDYIYEKKITVKGEFFLTDAIQHLISSGEKITTAPVDGWYDCGAFETLLETNQALLKKHPVRKSEPINSVIIEPVFIDDDVIIENSIIGPNVSIAKGAVIRNSIIVNSIIDTDAKLIDVKLSDSTVGEHAVMQGTSKKVNIGDSSEIYHS